MVTVFVRLAAVIYQSGFKIDDFLRRIADRLRAEQVKLAGALQENANDSSDYCSAMTVVDLTTQARFRISQELGPQAEGCRLDARGLADIGPLLDRAVNRDVELVIFNRFGKAESEGGGLRSAFARTMEAGIPILTAVREPYFAAWSEFHGQLGTDLAPESETVLAWCQESVRQRRAAQRGELTATS